MTVYWRNTNQKLSKFAQYLVSFAAWCDGMDMTVQERIDPYSLDNYQFLASETAIYPGKGKIAGLQYVTLGLCGEAGELANKVKKILRDGDGVLTNEVREHLKKEAGDTLWYLANFAGEVGATLHDIGKENLKKLADRKLRGTLTGSGDDR